MLRRLRFYVAFLKAFVRRDKRKITYGFIFLLLIVFLLRVLIPAATPKIIAIYAEAQKPTFVEGAVGKPEHPNPLFDSTETQKEISRLIFRSLTKIDVRGNLQPDLAKSFKKLSDTEYIFYLRENVFWHDGERFNSDDVVYTVKTAQDPKYDSKIAANFKDVEVKRINDFTVKFSLKEPFTPFPYATTVGIIPKHVALKKYKPIGTGGFKVKDISDDKIKLSNEKLNLEFRFYTSLEEAKTALKLGEIHALGGYTPQEIESVKKLGGKNLYQHVLPFRQAIVFFNTKEGLLKDNNIRQALAHATDKRLIQRSAGGESSVLATNNLQLSNWVVTSKERYPYNEKKAKRLLEKAGLKPKNGLWESKGKKLSITITAAKDPELNSIANLLKASWMSLGINVKTQIVSSEKLQEEIIPNRNFQVLVNFQEIPLDPDQYVLWHTTQVQKTNITGISSPKLDKLLEDARKTDDKKTRTEKYKLFTTLLLDEVPAIFLYYPQYIWVVSSKVTGIKLSGLSNLADRFDSYENWKIRKGLVF